MDLLIHISHSGTLCKVPLACRMCVACKTVMKHAMDFIHTRAIAHAPCRTNQRHAASLSNHLLHARKVLFGLVCVCASVELLRQQQVHVRVIPSMVMLHKHIGIAREHEGEGVPQAHGQVAGHIV